jgi:hypothetical protein
MDLDVKSVTLMLLDYCQREDFAGYEPYDALNSRLLQALPVLDFKLPRLALTQFLKRSPVNVRGLLSIPKTQNPKALALFLTSFLRLSRNRIGSAHELIPEMTERLIELRSPGEDEFAWGYNFPWQTRTVLVPRWAPNLVCTAFVADALLDAYEQLREERYLTMAESAANYILNRLYWQESDEVAGFSYPIPEMPSHRVHNANFLAAALLLRVHHHTHNERLPEPALRAARYAARQQQEDGGWAYGEAPTQQWIDNFHTGFNLCALRSIAIYSATTEFDDRLRRGLDFYLKHFFRKDGSVAYYHDGVYPLDAHCVAQAIITLLTLKDLEPEGAVLIRSVYRWAMENLWDERGFFYYRVLPYCTIRTSYMRWTQAWMFLALSMLLEAGGEGDAKFSDLAEIGVTRS